MKIMKENFAENLFKQNNFQDKMFKWLKDKQRKYNFDIIWVGDKENVHPGIELQFNCDRYNNAKFEYNIKTGEINFSLNIQYKDYMKNFLSFILCLNKMLINIKGFISEFEKLK